MRPLQNAASRKLLVFFLLAIIPALAIAMASPLWLGHETKTHAASAQSVTQQGAPGAPAGNQPRSFGPRRPGLGIRRLHRQHHKGRNHRQELPRIHQFDGHRVAPKYPDPHTGVRPVLHRHGCPH